MPPRFLDTNILLRYFTRDDEAKAVRALGLLQRIERGEEAVETSLIVVFETVYTLQRFYRVPRERIRELVWNVLALRGVRLPGKAIVKDALDLYVAKDISFADAYNAVYVKTRGLTEIYSLDKDFDRIDGVHRIEPSAEGTPDAESGGRST